MVGVIPEGTVIDPVQQFIILRIMGTCGIGIEIPSLNHPGPCTWLMICRGTNFCMDEVLVPKSDYHDHSKELITEKAVEFADICCKDWRHSSIEETHATSSKGPETVCSTQITIPMK